MKPILLFDIDGTLLKVKKSFTRELISEISSELNLDIRGVKNISFAGRTDKDIFSEFVSRHPDADHLYDVVKARYLHLMLNHFSAEYAEPINEAIESVHAAQENGIETGLCTGNFREAAFYKVEAVGLKNVFSFGGFGCNYQDRNHLPEEAHKEFIRLKGIEPEPFQYLVIGDTPKDILCARFFGAKSVAVTTGSYSEYELQKYKPDILVSSLSEIAKWAVDLKSP